MKVKKFVPLVSILVVIVVVATIASWFSTKMVVSKVECYTQFGPCPEEYYTSLHALLNQPILASLPRKDLEQAFKSNLQIESVELYRRMPNTVIASVKLRKPVGVVGASVLGMVDDQGMIFGETKDSDLPQLIYRKDLNLGDRLSPEYIKSIEILGKIYSQTGEKNKGELVGNILTVSLTSGTQIIVDISRDYTTWSSSLQSIFSRSRIDGKKVRKLDLRYLNPVVVY